MSNDKTPNDIEETDAVTTSLQALLPEVNDHDAIKSLQTLLNKVDDNCDDEDFCQQVGMFGRLSNKTFACD